MSAYTEGIPDSAWGKHWAEETGTSELLELCAYVPSRGRPGGTLSHVNTAALLATQALLNDPSSSD